jgi:hydrogenase-4 component F
MALYAILRFACLVNGCLGFAYFGKLMVFFGLVSLAVSSGFILVQKDLKRLLAYSSIEHIGIICVGFGIGSGPAILGALLHIYNHAVAKSLLFFGAGNIVLAYKKHNLNAIRSVLSVLPFTGTMVLLGVFALSGFPPFSIFVSELFIIAAAFIKGSYVVAALLLFFTAVIFAGLIYQFSRILFGNLPKDKIPVTETLSGKIVFLFLILQSCVLWPILPLFFKNTFTSIAQLLKGI